MKTLTAALLLSVIFACNPPGKNTPVAPLAKASEPYATEASFPFTFKDTGADTSHIIQLNDGIISRIKEVLRSECNGKDRNPEHYIATFQLRDSLYTLYIVTMNGREVSEPPAQVLFYNNRTKEFINGSYEYKLFANYNYTNSRFEPTELRKDFKVNGPDIEKLDYNQDGVTDYKFTRLCHNGTFNALSTTVISVSRGQIDTLYAKEAGYPIAE